MNVKFDPINSRKFFVRSDGVLTGTIQRDVRIIFPDTFRRWTFFPDAGVFTETEILAIGQKLVELNKTTD